MTLRQYELLYKFLQYWPLVTRKSHMKLLAAFNEINLQLKSTRQNAAGLVAEYNGLEEHKNKFVQQNFQLRASLTESQEQVKKLTLELARFTDQEKACEARQADG